MTSGDCFELLQVSLTRTMINRPFFSFRVLTFLKNYGIMELIPFSVDRTPKFVNFFTTRFFHRTLVKKLANLFSQNLLTDFELSCIIKTVKREVKKMIFRKDFVELNWEEMDALGEAYSILYLAKEHFREDEESASVVAEFDEVLNKMNILIEKYLKNFD